MTVEQDIWRHRRQLLDKWMGEEKKAKDLMERGRKRVADYTVEVPTEEFIEMVGLAIEELTNQILSKEMRDARNSK